MALRAGRNRVIVKVLDDTGQLGEILLPECVKRLYRCYVVDVGEGVFDVEVGDIVYLSFYPMQRVEDKGVEYCVVYGSDVLLKEEKGGRWKDLLDEFKDMMEVLK